MSDSDEAFSDELLELAGATDKKRKRRQAGAKGSKRRKAEAMASESEGDGPESEEEDDGMNPYPLENKYTDEYDRQRLLEMPEIEREEVLAQRQEELQRIQDKRNLDQMFKATKEGGGEDDSVSKAAKRAHAIRGATKEKSRQLDELKARRKAKDVKKKSRSSPEKRDRSSSPMEMETSDEDDEDGQITKEEQEEERERRLLGNEKASLQEEQITVLDLEKIRLDRDSLAKHCLAPWFEDYVKGAWVRYLIGQEGSQPIYRICEISNLAADLAKPYKVNNQMIDQNIELKHGLAVRAFPMDKVSNAPFTMREFDRLGKVCEGENVKLPSKRQIEKKSAQMRKLVSQPMTESDVSAMLQRKNQIQDRANPAVKSGATLLLEKTRLGQMRNLAMKRNDRAEVAVLDKQLKDLLATIAVDPSIRDRESESQDIMAKVNERNRKANQEGMRIAAMAEAERKRKERQAALSGTGSTAIDPSARLKTVPRMFTSRSGTPNVNGTSTPQPVTPGSASPVLVASPSVKPVVKDDFTSRVLESIEVDLGDF